MTSAITILSPPLILFSILGNTLTITAVYKTRSLRCRYAVLLTTSLACCDLLFSLLSCPVNFITTLLEMKKLNVVLCRINGFLGVLFCLTSLLTLSIVSFDRYIAIVTPFRYTIWMTFNRIKIIIASKWIFSALVASVPLTGWGNYVFFPQKGFCFIDYNKDLSAFFFIAIWFNAGFGLITYSYYYIFKEARRQKRQIRSLNVTTLAEQDANPEQQQSVVHQHRNNLRRIKHENKAAFTIFAIICGFIICWMPFVFVNLVAALTKSEVPYTADVVSTILVAVGSCVNPLFYAWLDGSFRMAFKRILYPIIGRNSSALVTAVSTVSGAH